MLEIGRQRRLQIRVDSVAIRAARALPFRRRSAIPRLSLPPSNNSLLYLDRHPLKLDLDSARILCQGCI